jgi:hypothetical protein
MLLTLEPTVMMVPLATPLLTLVTIEKLAEDPAVSAVATHVTAPADPIAGVVQLQPLGTDIDWKVVFAGTVVLKNTFEASLGPVLLTRCV